VASEYSVAIEYGVAIEYNEFRNKRISKGGQFVYF